MTQCMPTPQHQSHQASSPDASRGSPSVRGLGSANRPECPPRCGSHGLPLCEGNSGEGAFCGSGRGGKSDCARNTTCELEPVQLFAPHARKCLRVCAVWCLHLPWSSYRFRLLYPQNSVDASAAPHPAFLVGFLLRTPVTRVETAVMT